MRAPLIALALLAAAGPSWAATDGALGATSTATVEVSTTVENAIAETVQVSGLQDLDFGTVGLEDPFADPVSRTSPACFYHTGPSFRLTVTQAGGSIGTPFQLLGPQGDAIPVTIDIFGGPSAFGAVGFALSGAVGNREDPTCATGVQSEIVVTRLPLDQPRASGVYTASFSIVMAVE